MCLQLARLSKEQSWLSRYNISIGGYDEITGDYRFGGLGWRERLGVGQPRARRRLGRGTGRVLAWPPEPRSAAVLRVPHEACALGLGAKFRSLHSCLMGWLTPCLNVP
jgi:hypothetical protein